MSNQISAHAVCVLGMHRSGTSTLTRAVNLLGAYLGPDKKMMPASPDNSEGYWEHLDFYFFQSRLLARLGRTWDTAEPLPADWLQAEAIRPFKKELAKLIAGNFSGQEFWAWKDPQTCLLLPLWRETLKSNKTILKCIFVVRNPLDVAGSIFRRDKIPFNRALDIWFHYNLTALTDAAGLPAFFVAYESFIASWEGELRRCAAALELPWPKDERNLRASMDAFIKPGLRHNQAPPERLDELPRHARELYGALSDACSGTAARLEETASRLMREFRSSFQPAVIPPPPPRWLGRTLNRWEKSIRKRLPKP